MFRGKWPGWPGRRRSGLGFCQPEPSKQLGLATPATHVRGMARTRRVSANRMRRELTARFHSRYRAYTRLGGLLMSLALRISMLFWPVLLLASDIGKPAI